MRKIRLLLYPLGVIYDLITSLRNFFFDIGILPQFQPPVTTIAVGNLSTGGTGKTPAIEYLIRHSNAKNIGVISRGYGRSTRGYIEVTTSHPAHEVGDEPLQIKKKYGDRIHLAVSEKRVDGIQQLTKKYDLDLILLDDAYQHRHVLPHHYILLTSYDRPYYKDYVLPAGDLRESSAGADRAKTIILTKCPQDLSKSQMQAMVNCIRPKAGQQVFFSYISYADVLQGAGQLPLQEVPHKKVTVVTGIAKPEPLIAFLKTYFEVSHLKFADHHVFKTEEIALISRQDFVITTEKDFMRLEKHRLKHVYYLPMEMKFVGGAEPELF
jgi:tetraacyldisaccharide 4'-kinase